MYANNDTNLLVSVNSRTHKAESTSSEDAGVTTPTTPSLPSQEYACHICCRKLSSAPKLASHLLSHVTAGRPAIAGASVSLDDVNALTVTVKDDSKETKTKVEDVTTGDDNDYYNDEVTHDAIMKPSVRHALVCSHVGCTKAFWSRVGLAQHLRTHNNERPFKCGECDASFTSRSSLNQHASVHNTGEGAHRCGWCGTCFDRRGNLDRHTAAGVCAPSSSSASSSSSLDSLLAVPLDFSGAVDDVVAAIESGDESPLTVSSSPSSSPSQSQGNWSPASADEYSSCYSPEYDFISSSLGASTSSTSPYSVTSYDDVDADATPAYTPSWCSPDSVASVMPDGDCSPAYSECNDDSFTDNIGSGSSNNGNGVYNNDNVAQLLAVVPSATSLIGDALYDPSAPSSSLWGDLALEAVDLQPLSSL